MTSDWSNLDKWVVGKMDLCGLILDSGDFAFNFSFSNSIFFSLLNNIVFAIFSGFLTSFYAAVLTMYSQVSGCAFIVFRSATFSLSKEPWPVLQWSVLVWFIIFIASSAIIYPLHKIFIGILKAFYFFLTIVRLGSLIGGFRPSELFLSLSENYSKINFDCSYLSSADSLRYTVLRSSNSPSYTI